MEQCKHKRCSFSRNRIQPNVEWNSVNTSGVAFGEIDQPNVEWYNVNTSGAALMSRRNHQKYSSGMEQRKVTQHTVSFETKSRIGKKT